ncbi:MAG: hypothetical protein HRT58_02535 [Crocinitomicaceae bacterium]|nr:hypothetical protein [Flavobacteriales bacterium]NQZ34506.1 hypothetical protein [Crocinitomicaceae bacterium]
MSKTELPPNAIPIAKATNWVNRWRESDGNLPKKGFLIPKIDITEVMQESGVTNLRSYLAIDDDLEFHLLTVGVDVEGNDMVDEAAGQYVYDFTKPCPPICSETGPLK